MFCQHQISQMKKHWQMRRRAGEKNAEIHLSELAPLIIGSGATLMVILCHDEAVNLPLLNEVFDLKQKAFSHARPVFSYCSCRQLLINLFSHHMTAAQCVWPVIIGWSNKWWQHLDIIALINSRQRPHSLWKVGDPSGAKIEGKVFY